MCGRHPEVVWRDFFASWMLGVEPGTSRRKNNVCHPELRRSRRKLRCRLLLGRRAGNSKSNTKTKMATLKLNLARQNPTQLIASTDLVLAKMDPPAPGTPAIAGLTAETAALKAKRDAADASNKNYEDVKAGLISLKQQRDADADALRVENTAFADAVSAKAKGNAIILASSGYPLAAEKVQSTEPPAQILNLTLTQADEDGALDGSHEPAARASTYEVQVTTTDPVAGPFVTKLQPTASSWKLTGLTSGQRVWVRVRGIGTNGLGPWSDPATKIVP